MALVLLVGAGLLVRSFQGLLQVNEHYEPETLLTMNLTLPETQYAQPSQRLNFHEQVLQRLAALPGLQTAALVSHVPYADGGGGGPGLLPAGAEGGAVGSASRAAAQLRRLPVFVLSRHRR